MGTNDGTVDEYLFEIRILSQFGEDTMPHAAPRPSRKALIDAVPEAQFRGQIAPGTAGTGQPQHRFDEQAIVGRGAARISGLARQQSRYSLKLTIAQPQTYHPDPAEKSGYDHNSLPVDSPSVTH